MIRSVTPDSPPVPNPREVAVVFLFPDSSEIRYLSKPPARRTRVRSSNGKSFMVATILPSGERTFTAHCVAQAVVPPRAMARRGAEPTSEHESDDLPSQLLGLVRLTVDAPARLRRRHRMRHYIP